MSCFEFYVKNVFCMTLYYLKGSYVSKSLNITCFLLFLNTQILLCQGKSQGVPGNTKPINFHYLHDVTGVVYSQLGDINIGDITDIYPWKNQIKCRLNPHTERLTDNTEPLKFAVDWVNKRSNLLPNVTMGFVIRGTCLSLSMTLANSLSFLPRSDKICNESNCYTQRMVSSSDNEYTTHDVIGMLSPTSSTLAAVLSSLFTMTRVPLVGYGAGSYELSSTYYHPYFFRINTPDYYQIQGILKFVSDNGWSYIQFIYRNNYYGRDARKFMYDLAGRYGVCIAASHALSSYGRVAKDLLREPLARAVIVFMVNWRFNSILKQINLLKATGHFIWIGSDIMEHFRYFNYPTMSTNPAIGAFHIYPFTNFVSEYYDYVRTIDIHNTKNPWIKKNWEILRGCSYAECPKNESEKLNYGPRKRVSLRIDAVLTFAYAAHNLLQDRCPGARGKEARACITGKLLREYLKKVKFDGFNGPVEFNTDQDVVGKFSIMQLKSHYPDDMFYKSDKGRIYDQPVAVYDSISENITYLDHPISWSHLNTVERLVPLSNDSLVKNKPESVCSRPCVVGEYKIEKDLPCCWDCLRCRDNERLINENTGCEACPLFQWPHPMSDFTTCVDIPLSYQTLEDPIPIALVSIAVLVLILNFFVYCAYVKYRNERVIKASSKELSFIQLVGISSGYITVILFQTTPTDITCRCIFFLFSMSFAMLYSPLLVKTVRIFRIFRSASENKKPRFVSPQSQLIISVLLIAIQLLLCGVVYFLYMPGARRTQPIWSEKMVELSCDFTIPGLSSFLGYNILLVSLCSVFAFMVRKLPDNYNESRFISMCVSTTLLIWMAFIPTYFTADREYMRMFLLCMALLLNHSVALILCFFPRIYAAAFMSDESLNFAIKK